MTTSHTWLTVGDVRAKLIAFVDGMRINIIGFDFIWPDGKHAHLLARVDVPGVQTHYHLTSDGKKMPDTWNFYTDRSKALAAFRSITKAPGVKYGIRTITAVDEELESVPEGQRTWDGMKPGPDFMPTGLLP